jgi:1,4-alpha-glucan branching enzyme
MDSFIELMPISEHPLDESGQQTTGYFGVTSRFGTPDDFATSLILPCSGSADPRLGPAHFPKDSGAGAFRRYRAV